MSTEVPRFSENLTLPSATEIVRNPERVSHSGIVLVTGVSGAGKDFLIDEAKKRTAGGPELKFAGYGSFLAAHFGMPSDVLRSQVSEEDMRKGQMDVMEKIKGMAPVVLTSHVVAKHGETYLTNHELEHALNPYKYVVVRSDPEQIAFRRQKDQDKRTRVAETADEIAAHQDRIIATVDQLSKENRSGFVIIDNVERSAGNERNFDYNVGLLSRVLQTIQYPIQPFV